MTEPGSGTVEAIWLKPAPGEPMVTHREVRAVAERGLAGNHHQGGKRQVTLIEVERWGTVQQALGRPDLPITARRANLVIRGLALRDGRGGLLLVGRCRLRVLGETQPCSQMDQAAPGLQAALAEPWAAGAYGRLLDDGVIRVGDEVCWLERPHQGEES